jgi:hypothetical protein
MPQQINLPEIRAHIYLAGILTCESDLPGVGVLLIVWSFTFVFGAQLNILQRT